MNKKPVKEKIKAKAEATKDKVKGKLKGAKPCIAVLLVVLCAALAGCLDTAPASRATTANYRIEIAVKVGDNAKDNKFELPFTLGDGALASADSEGSTETQTITPTMDVKPDIDVAYNDAIKNATDASRGVLEKLTDAGASAVLKMMAGKSSGSITVPTKDGGTMVVKCEDGQCSECSDCTP